ncbi:mechanosensitive ion channel family protein [Treponema sp. C6A8]|uniref:mechanosensitive ion channel family protein n=1 Tax=Treponema sp. C6A8 TaxID=1410609 RepID=UPI00068688A4|nr:mechanosensitive ion channel family protein [Treponema sp. C6A8]
MKEELVLIKNDFLKFITTSWDKIDDFITVHYFFVGISILLVLFIYYVIYRLVRKGIRQVNEEKLPKERKEILTRFARYIFYFAVGVYVLGLFGIKLSAIWGAAGIAGVAIGFAAQTSVSNLISGIFIVSEKSIKLGDTIIINGVTGVVDTISLLSVRVHTHDNQMVRIPNSSIINSLLTNNSYNSYRRYLLNVSVAYESDLALAMETLKKAPALCPTARTDPAPNAWIDSFGESGINLILAIWFDNSDFLAVKTEAFIAVKKVFDEAKIEIPYNKIVVHNA